MVDRGKMIIVVTIVGLIAIASQSWAKGIKERMRDRLPAIAELKQQGIVGENNAGYLEFVNKNKAKKEGLIEEENSDRRTVYQAIAQKTGTSVEKVGQRRAIQIAEKAEPGEWLQNEKGKWYQKK